MPATPTVCQAVDAYLSHLRLRAAMQDFSADAIKDVARDLKRFATHCEGRDVRDLSNDDLLAFLAHNPQWRSNHTKKRVLNCILRCFRWLEEEAPGDLRVLSPLRRPRILRRLPTKPRREAQPWEYVRLMRCRSRSLRRAIYFLWNTGCRTSEMRGLEWPGILWDERVIVIRNKTEKATGRERIIGLTARMVRFLRNLKRQAPPWTPRVFLNADKQPWNRHAFARCLRRWAKRIGLDDGTVDRVSGYCFRHSLATEAEEAGMADGRIADQLGHADSRMLRQVYSKARSRARHLRGVAEEVERQRRALRKKK